MDAGPGPGRAAEANEGAPANDPPQTPPPPPHGDAAAPHPPSPTLEELNAAEIER